MSEQLYQKTVGNASEVLEGQYMPYSASFEATDIYKKIIRRLPVVVIHELNTSSPGKAIYDMFKTIWDNSVNVFKSNLSTQAAGAMTNDKETADSVELDIDSLSGYETNLNTIFEPILEQLKSPDGGGKGIDLFSSGSFDGIKGIETALPLSIKMFFSTFASDTINKYCLRIHKSPQITLESSTSAGWSNGGDSLLQMIFDSTNKILGIEGGNIKGFTKSIGKNVTDLVTWLGHDMQFGPFFKVTEVTKDKPSFSFSTILVNDSAEAARKNKKIIRNLTMGTLPGAQEMFMFKPGNLFNISVQIGTGTDDATGDPALNALPIKKLFLCTGQIRVSAKGIYRDNITPELYEINCTFKSLLPDYINLQMVDFDKYSKTTLFGIGQADKADTTASEENDDPTNIVAEGIIPRINEDMLTDNLDRRAIKENTGISIPSTQLDANTAYYNWHKSEDQKVRDLAFGSPNSPMNRARALQRSQHDARKNKKGK